MRDGCAGFGGCLLDGGFEFHSGEAVIHRGGAQDQPSAFRTSDGVEGVGGSARSAGERVEILDDHVVAKNRPENSGEFFFHPCSFLLGCPNLNIRWATRRIWISSAPSVIR